MAFETDYFDIWNIFSNEIVGSILLSIIIAFILVYFFSAKFRFPFQIAIMMGILLGAVLYALTLEPIIWVIVLLVVGTLFYFMVSSKIRKG